MDRQDFSLVRDDPPFRWHQRIGLVPRSGGLGVGRRAIFWTAVAWLPVALWAWSQGAVVVRPGHAPEPLLQHFGVNARLLLGIPLLIIAEAVAHGILSRQIPYFVDARLVKPDDIPRFDAIVARAVRLRDRATPWVIILGLALAWALTGTLPGHLLWLPDEAPWAARDFGGFWHAYVARPIFLVLLLGWLWRVILLAILFKGIAALDLVLVPTHPDRAGGLGFVERSAAAFSLVVLAPAVVTAARWAHDAGFHGLDVHSLYPVMGTALVATLVVFLAPYLMFSGPLLRARRQALLDYGALVARHGAAVRGKWILGEVKPDEPLLSAPEIGPVADTITLYEAVSRMRPVPIGAVGLLAIAVPVALPFLGVLAVQIPVKDMLLELAKGVL
ncbi:MAG TPA: hypothetical protein VHJ77_19850 [Vicinamibacterales bacterium]|jgi:hypothetical protein|nr:hypothetical protein [Vicinamibacterales bacterium]